MKTEKEIAELAFSYAINTELKHNYEAKVHSYITGYNDCQKEYEEKIRWIPTEEDRLNFTGIPFYIIVKNVLNEINLVYIEEHSDINEIIESFTHWREIL